MYQSSGITECFTPSPTTSVYPSPLIYPFLANQKTPLATKRAYVKKNNDPRKIMTGFIFFLRRIMTGALSHFDKNVYADTLSRCHDSDDWEL